LSGFWRVGSRVGHNDRREDWARKSSPLKAGGIDGDFFT